MYVFRARMPRPSTLGIHVAFLVTAVVCSSGDSVAALDAGLAVDDLACSVTGPATRQNDTARLGGVVLSDAPLPATGDPSVACAARCCRSTYDHVSGRQPCRSWTVHRGNCSLRGLYSAPTSLVGAVSGVVYRTNVLGNKPVDVGAIRGFNYVPASKPSDLAMWRDYAEAEIERDMGFAHAAGFNFARVFLSYTVWSEGNSTMFLQRLQHFISTAHRYGVMTMPVIFDPCFDGCKDENITIHSDGDCWYPSPKPADMESAAWWENGGQAFVRALATALPPTTPGLSMWDVVNEPGHHSAGLPFAAKVADYLHKVSRGAVVTVGLDASVANVVQRLEMMAPHVDVLAFHSYHDSWEAGLEMTELALSVSRKWSKPVFNSETGCIARASAYDQTIELAVRNGIGYAVWELMISDCLACADTRRWKHGLFYTDGTTRDPAAIAAVRGIYLNRGDVVPLAVPRPDVEHKPATLAKAVTAWLQEEDPRHKRMVTTNDGDCRQEPAQVLQDTNIHGGSMGEHPYRAIDISLAQNKLSACSAACCEWEGCAAWVVQAGTVPSKNDQQCTAATSVCCWLKPNANGRRTTEANSTAGVVTASPQRPVGPVGPPPPPTMSHFNAGIGLLDSIAGIVESAGLSAMAVSLSQAARRLAARGGGVAAMEELRAVLAAQVSPSAALLGAACGQEVSPAVCTFNMSTCR